MDGGLLITAGALLLALGLVTDVIGFLLATLVIRYPIHEVFKCLVAKPCPDRHADGFVIGNVWMTGFSRGDSGPDNPGGPPNSSGGSGPSGSGSSDGSNGDDSAYDADPDPYRFDRGNNDPT